MSLECSECERDARGPHNESCSRYIKPFEVGERVLVTDPGLARLRDIMRAATGQEPPPNHHGTVSEVWDDDGEVLIDFDDGIASPWPVDKVQRLLGDSGTERTDG